MFLKSITLTNFRNYSKQQFKFSNRITILIGENAQGKTNFLESIYFLSTVKSKKADREEELIKKGEEFLRVEGVVEGKEKEEVSLEVALAMQEGFLRKKIKVNGISRRVFDYNQNLVAVEFSPEDINLVPGSPSQRLYHIDSLLCQVDREYKKTLSAYENIITRKNKLLKTVQEGFAKREELDYWIDQQILLGSVIVQKREEFFEYINSAEKKFGEFNYQYLESKLSLERIREYLDREIASASSLIGPHRDDFKFLLKEEDLAKFGSRGEQRTAVLDLKFAEVLYVEKVLGDRPLLLLDDIFSELDFAHKKHVLDLANLQQTIITSVDIEKDLEKTFKDAQVLTVEEGEIF